MTCKVVIIQIVVDLFVNKGRGTGQTSPLSTYRSGGGGAEKKREQRGPRIGLRLSSCLLASSGLALAQHLLTTEITINAINLCGSGHGGVVKSQQYETDVIHDCQMPFRERTTETRCCVLSFFPFSSQWRSARLRSAVRESQPTALQKLRSCTRLS